MPNITSTAQGGLTVARREPVTRAQRRAGTAALRIAPAVALAVLVAWLLTGHSATDGIVAMARFWVFGITLPGMVLWRLATPVRHNLVEDSAAGALVGSAVLLLVYMASAPLGLQEWAWLWCLPVLAAAAAVPAWRGRCLRRVEQPLKPAAAWLVAVACSLPLYWTDRYLDASLVPYTDPRAYSPDMAFHHALAASAKYDFPLQAPYVDGERMQYHSFYHQLIAATSWPTGVDLTDLMYYLSWIPILLAGTALIFVLTDRLAPNVTWAGPLAILVAALGGTINVYPGLKLISDALVNYVWGSPTQNLGGGLMVVLALLGVDLVRGRGGVGLWVLFLVVAAAASGSKATVLPIALCGMLLVVFVRLLYGRFARAALAGAAVCAGLFALAVVLVFGGHSSGMVVKPWVIFAKVPPYALVAEPGAVADERAMWICGSVSCLALLLGTAGLLVLPGTGRRWLRDPGAVFLIGCAIAGFGGMILTDQPGGSQLYFHRTAVPLIAALAAAGAWLLVFWFGDRRAPIVVLAALATGAGASAVAREIVRAGSSGGRPYRTPTGDVGGVVGPWLWTIGLLFVGAVLVTVAWKAARRRGRPSRVLAASFVLAGMGAGLLVPLETLAQPYRPSPPPLTDSLPLGPTATQAAAARWLGEHTAPGELIATNAHCIVKNIHGCDNRHFWISALSERHVLVEGWGYTNTINDLVAGTGKGPNSMPFWDQQRLTDNDVVFTAPTRDNLRLLGQKYGVRWLYADPGQTAVSRELDTLATLRFKVADARVYELR